MKTFKYLILLILLFACSANDGSTVDTDISSTSTSISENIDSDDQNSNTSTTTLADEFIESYQFDMDKMSPFTGLVLDNEVWLQRPRRVIAFKIDNNFNARPQSGLQEADSVMEILVEGGMTRFLAYFMDKKSSYLGPIRSARPTDPTLISPYGGILVVSGATAGLIPHIRDLGVPVLEEVGPPTMFRISDRSAPHNLYADTELVRKHVDDRGFYFNQYVKPLYDFGNNQSNWKSGANRITVKYSDFTTIVWKIDNENYSRFIVDGYTDSADAVSHNFITIDGYTDILKAETIVAIQGPLYKDEKTNLPSVLTVGVGPVYIFSEGKYIEGTWRRNDISDPFEFIDNDQQPIEVPPSKQWIHIMPLNGEVSFSDN